MKYRIPKYRIPKKELARRKPVAKQVPGEKAHATYSASGASRWLACAGSTELSKKAPPIPDNAYSEEGTKAHACLEFILGNRCSSASLKMAAKQYPSEMIEHALFFAKYVLKRLAKLDGAELLIEVRSDLPVSEPGQFGTADVVIVQPYGRLIVMDFKYGAMPVEVNSNPQLIYYALGIAHKYGYDFNDVELVVGQPRCEIDGKKIRSWVTEIDDLRTWRRIFERGIQISKVPNAELNSGAHCKYCPARVICPQISKAAMAQAKIDFNDDVTEITAPKADMIAIPNLGKVLIACDSLETWIGSVRAHAYHVASRGKKIEGFKLVPKRATRKWIDAEVTAATAKLKFGAKAFTKPVLLSPAQLEQISKSAKKFVLVNTASVSTGLTLARDSDKRTGVNPAASDFDEPSKKAEVKAKKIKRA